MSLEERLRLLNAYIVRNPYTGASSLDIDALVVSPEFRKLLGSVWADGYNNGLDDGISDCYIEQAHQNPYT